MICIICGVYMLLNTQVDAVADLTARSSGGANLDMHSHAQCSQKMFGTCHGNSQSCCPSVPSLTCSQALSMYRVKVLLNAQQTTGNSVMGRHTIRRYIPTQGNQPI